MKNFIFIVLNNNYKYKRRSNFREFNTNNNIESNSEKN